jgi:hypothetical protein
LGDGSASPRRIDGLLRLDLAVYDGLSGGPLAAPSGAVAGIELLHAFR